MEEEEREAQSAKLQELIRRGTPEDLQEANRLMKVMAGYDTRTKVDYRAKAAEEVGKIQQKARLLEERLESFAPGEKMTDGDVFSELAAALQSAQPKIQKMCEEESDDHEAVAKLLEINDSIHRTVERYKLMKKGDLESANQIAKGNFVSTSSGGKPKPSAAPELSLIDFDADANGASSAGQPASSQAGGSLENDLLGLSLGDDASYGQPGSIALGFGANNSKSGSYHESNSFRYLTVPINRRSRPSAPLVDNAKQQCQGTVIYAHPSSGFLLLAVRGFQLGAISLPVHHSQPRRAIGVRAAQACFGRPLRRSRLFGLLVQATESRAPCAGERRRRVVLLLRATRRGPACAATRAQASR